MKSFTKHAVRHTNKNSVIFGMVFVVLIGLLGPKAYSQTAYQLAQQMRERAEQLREAEQMREEKQERAREAEQLREQELQERQAEAQREQPRQQNSPGTSYSSGTPSSVQRTYVPATATSPVPIYTPRATSAGASYSPETANSATSIDVPGAAATSSARVYTPHSSSESSPVGVSGGSTTTYTSANGVAVYTPHAVSTGTPASTSAGSTDATARTVYTPHGLAATDGATSAGTSAAASDAPSSSYATTNPASTNLALPSSVSPGSPGKTDFDIAYDTMLEYLLEKGTGVWQSWEGAYQAALLKAGSAAANLAANNLGSELLSKVGSSLASEAAGGFVTVMLSTPETGGPLDTMTSEQWAAYKQAQTDVEFFEDPTSFCFAWPNDTRCSADGMYRQLLNMNVATQRSLLEDLPSRTQLQQSAGPHITNGRQSDPQDPYWWK